MSNKFIEMFEKIKALDEPQMLQIIANAESELNQDFVPQVILVSNSSAKKEIMESLSGLIGSTHAVLEELANTENNYIVKMQYGNDWNGSGFDDTESGLDVTNLFIPWDVLKNMHILWVCTSSPKNIPNNLIINSDKLLLVTNAIMAMTQEEKEFLTNVRKSIFNDEPITISLCNKLSLNTQEDLDALCVNVTKLIARYGETITFIDDFSNALYNQFACIPDEQLKTKREKRILTACFHALEAYSKSQIALAEAAVDRLNETMKKIEEERKNIEFSSKLVLSSTIENMYSEMKHKIIVSADKYSDDACESIRERLTVSTTIEKDINNIIPYLKTVWANFEKEIGKYMASEQEQIASVLEQQIFSDCKKIVDILEIGIDRFFAETTNLSKLVAVSFDEMDESKAKKNKMISKGMLIASLALAFVNPLWGLAGVAGTSVFTLSNNKNLDEAKAKVLFELPNECNSIKCAVESQIEAVIEKAKKESCDNVWKVYSEVLDNLMTEIFRYMDEIQTAKEKVDMLQNVLNNEILKAKINLNAERAIPSSNA